MKKPDYFIIGAAIISFLFSVSLWFGLFGEEQKLAGIFVGIWVPSILAAGIFVKTGSKGVK